MRISETTGKTRIVVVGNGLVGHRFVEDLRERDPDAELSITVIGEEPRLAYDRVHLALTSPARRRTTSLLPHASATSSSPSRPGSGTAASASTAR